MPRTDTASVSDLSSCEFTPWERAEAGQVLLPLAETKMELLAVGLDLAQPQQLQTFMVSNTGWKIHISLSPCNPSFQKDKHVFKIHI